MNPQVSAVKFNKYSFSIYNLLTTLAIKLEFLYVKLKLYLIQGVSVSMMVGTFI